MTAFYNEVDPFAAKWLRNLIVAGHIAPGIVDERPIQEIEAWELVGFTQCHFFAGIGVWSHVLRRAGWPDNRPIWTGSCPCQPFSNAGQKKGFSDERHLWPYWQKLIDERKPSVVVGEQVASKDGLAWFDLVSADLEASSYAVGAADLCAAGFDGFHIRQRFYFVGLADAEHARLQGHGRFDRMAGETAHRHETPTSGHGAAGSDLLSRYDWWVYGGKKFPLQSGTFPLVDAAPSRVGRLRAYGNALDAETATQFCFVVKEICDEIGI